MSRSPLAPGEIAIASCELAGHRFYERVKEDGTREVGTLVGPDHPCAAHAAGYVRAGSEVRPGVRRVVEHVAYTARGPAQVASDRYRSGWDAVFDNRPRGGGGCDPSQAN